MNSEFDDVCRAYGMPIDSNLEGYADDPIFKEVATMVICKNNAFASNFDKHYHEVIKALDFGNEQKFYPKIDGEVVAIRARTWGGFYYLEKLGSNGAWGHVYCTPVRDRIVYAIQFCMQGWEPTPYDDPLGSPGFPEFPDEVRGPHNGYYGGEEDLWNP